MHWVNRGQEPTELDAVRVKFTPGWVAYYPHRRGTKPTDDKWRAFQHTLSTSFKAICGYCEEYCYGHVDHFRPKSKFPDRVYDWENWVLACPFCNTIGKREKWPANGYVNPCENKPSDRPESCFVFDTKTGELLPKPALFVLQKKRAQQMINDLQLNAFAHLKHRVQWLNAVQLAIKGVNPADADIQAWVMRITAPDAELASITRQFLKENSIL